jgi:hypothetical protein
MTSRYYTMTDSTGASGFLPTVVFDGSSGVFTSAHRTNRLSSIGITGFYEADFADSVTDISNNAFLNDTKVVVVTINKVQTIGEYAFSGCTVMRSITLDTAIDATSKKYVLTTIGRFALHNCPSLRNLHIPDTVKNIPEYMCNSCTNLEIAVMGYGCASRDANDNYIVDGTIGIGAFGGCSKLQFFIIPETVGSVGNSAFFNSPLLSYVAILGKPTFGTNVFGNTLNTSAARYVYDICQNLTSIIPSNATKNQYYEYEFTASASNTITSANVITRLDGLSPVPTWIKVKIKGTGTGYVQTIGTNAFRSYEMNLTTAHYSKIIGFSFHSNITTIQYGAFEAYNGTTTSGTVCNMAAHYIPNSATGTTFDTDFGSYTFNLAHQDNVAASQTRQIVFQSGPNKIQLGRYMFRWNSARAIILYDIASTHASDTIKGIPLYGFINCFYLQFCNFFQKNAYSTFTRINGQAFNSTFMSGWTTSGRHYIHIPKQIQASGFADVFLNTNSNILFTVYDKYLDGTAGTGIEGLGTNTAGTASYITTVGFGIAAAYATFHIICNWYDANGLLNGTFKAFGYDHHILFHPSVKTITDRFGLGGAGSDTRLKSIAIPYNSTNLVDISGQAFYNCRGLTYVYLNNRVNSIGSSALRNVPFNASFDLIDAAPLVAIFDAAFHNDTGTSNLTQITIPKTVKALGAYVFGGTSGLRPYFTTLSFENGIAFWGDFDYTRSGATVSNMSTTYGTNTGNAAYMAIPAYFCMNCGFLRNVSFLNTVMDLSGTPVPNDGLALARPNNSMPIPTRYNQQILDPPILRIGKGAFISNYRLQSIRIPDGVTTIDFQAFYDMYSGSYVYLPDSLTTLGLAAFNYVGLGNVFGYVGLEVSVRIPQALIDLVVPETLNVNTGYFNSNSTTTLYFTVSFNYSSSKVTNGVLGRFTNQAVNNYIKYHVITLNGISGILGGTTANARAFDSFTSLKTVTIADTVTNIGQRAFSGCTGLTNVFISPTSNLTLLENGAFVGCSALTSFFIPNSITGIDTSVFNGTGLTSVTYGDNPGLKYIGHAAFYATVKALASIFIPSSVVYLGSEAFINDNAVVNILNTVTFGAGSRLRSIGQKCFGLSTNTTNASSYLRDLVLPNTIRAIGMVQVFRVAFTKAHSANLVFPSSLEYLSESILYSDSGSLDISNIYLPFSITNVAGPRNHSGYITSGVGLNVFSPNASKSNSLIYLPSHLSGFTSGGATAFPDVNRARSYYKTASFTTNPLLTLSLSTSVPTNTTIPGSTTQIHANIQEGVIVIGGGTSIASVSSGNALNLISMNIPSTVSDICANAFNGCSALVYVTFSENSHLTTIGNSAFLGCSMIHDITLPDSLTTIGPNAFSGCYNLASISIPYNVTSIGAGAFNVNSSSPTTYIPRQGGYLAKQLGGDIYGEAVGDYSGFSVSISGDGKILAIGSYLNAATGKEAGQVRVYKYQTITDATWSNYTVNSFLHNGLSSFNKPIVVNGGDPSPIANKYYWVQLGSDINGEGGFSGWAVSISSDGTTVAIGALVNTGAGGDAGQVRVYKYQTIAAADWTNYTVNSFTYTGTAPTNKPIVVNGGDAVPVTGKFYWVQLGADIDGETVSSQSGNSVSLSSNGQILAIGARFDDLNGATDSGSVRVYQYSSGTGTWSKLGTTITAGLAGDEFGTFVSLNDAGTVVAIAAGRADNGAALDAGIVRVYAYSSNTWTQRGSNIIGDAQWDYSGASVSLNSDGTILAIGAIGNDGTTGLNADNRGQVRVYKYTTVWTKLGQNLNGLAAGDEFGVSVSLNTDGTILAVGSRLSDTGSLSNTGLVRIYEYFNSSWQQLGQDIRGEIANDQAAWSVSLSKDGTTVAFGAHFNDGNGTDSGMVRVYQISNFTVRLHQRLYDTIHGSFSTYFPGISPGSVQVIPALTLTNTLNPSKLTISQINNLYIRYRQSQLKLCIRVTVAASYEGTLTASDITNALSGTTGLVHLDISTNVINVEAEICYNNSNTSRIYSVAIPQTVTNIRFSAFNGCTNLTYLSFHPDSVCNTIAAAAFHNTNIYDLALPDSLTTIASAAFWSSLNLTSVCIPKNVTSLGANAFANCIKLTSVALPSSLAALANASYFSKNNDGTTAPGTFTIYEMSAAIPHFKLSDYSMPIGIVQTVIDSAVTYIDHRAYAYYPDITIYAVTTNKQTQTAGQYNYVMNGIKMPFQPAAFIINPSNWWASTSMFPIYRSVPDLNVFTLSNSSGNWVDNSDDYYILMPGYSMCIYNNLYDEENLFDLNSPIYNYYDNEFGKVPLNINIPSGIINTTSSILIMYNGRILSKYFTT